MDRLDCDRMFVAVMEAGSFARAARRLGTSSGQASKLVSRLEEDLGGEDRAVDRGQQRHQHHHQRAGEAAQGPHHVCCTAPLSSREGRSGLVMKRKRSHLPISLAIAPSSST